jgi:manganese/iron transport system permease protein
VGRQEQIMSWLDSYVDRAVVELVVVGTLAAIIGVQVVLRRLAFFTMAMTHASFPGVVLAALVGVNLYLGGATAGLLVCLAVTYAARRRGQDVATVTGVVLATGFALGAAVLSTQPGFSRDLSAYMVGSVLTVDRSDLTTAIATGLAVAVTLAALRKELTLAAFDRQTARAVGYPILALDLLVLVCIEAAVITAMPAVGAILAVSLIVAPAAAARLWTDRLPVMHAVAIGIAVGCCLTGLALSQRYNVATGATITVLATVAFGGSLLLAPQRGIIQALIAGR